MHHVLREQRENSWERNELPLTSLVIIIYGPQDYKQLDIFTIFIHHFIGGF